MLFLALARWPYGYYQILRWVVCGASAWSVYLAIQTDKNGWAWTLGTIAVLFNPILPIYLTRDIWSFLDIVTGITLLASLQHVKASPHD